MRGGVEGSAVDSLAVAANQSFHARQHLLRRATSECQKKDSFGGDAALDQVCNAIDEGARFSGAGAGDDEKWPIAIGRGRGLLWIELRREVANIPRSFSAWPCGIDLERVTHATVSRSVEREVTTAVRSNASANLALTRSLTSCMEISSSPASRAIDVITTPSMPHGIMRSKKERSVVTLRANPCHVTQSRAWTPIEAIFFPRVQTPV